jgi:hypothetical protein
MAGVHLLAVSIGRPWLGSEGRPDLVRERLVLLLTDLLAIALACERFFYALLLTWFQIKGVTLDFLDNVFGLHLALKAAQSIFKGFAFLYSNLCQEKYTSKRSPIGINASRMGYIYTRIRYFGKFIYKESAEYLEKSNALVCTVK